MVLGLLPAIRGGLADLARSGQHTRLIDGYFRPYARAFDEVRYFSYHRESLEQYVADPELGRRVRLFAGGGWHPWVYAFVMAVRHARALRGCAVFRVYQITGVIPAVIARRRWGTPFVTTYGFWYARLARSRATAFLRTAVERLGLRAAAAVIVTTPELRAYVASRVGSAKVHLVPNGVDTSRFRPVRRPRGRRTTVLYVGRLAPEKNLAVLVEAAGRLAGRLDLRLVFVGEGPSRAALAARAGALGVPVEFLPVMDHRELPRAFDEANAFVLPSFTEGHPKVLLEAMSAGVPCVASDVGGNRAILADGEVGLLFPPHDADALARSLGRLVDEPTFADTLAARARARVLERYDLTRLVQVEIELLRSVAGAG